MTWAAFATVVLIHLVAAISPGLSFVVSLRVAASAGFRSAAGLALGFGFGAFFWALAAMAGLAVLFELVPALFSALKVIGGAFLIYIAYKMWAGARAPLETGDDLTMPRSFGQAVRFGFVTFAMNPKPAVFFGAVFVGLIPADTTAPWRLAILLAVFLNETLWYLVVAKVFSMPRARAAYRRLKTTLDRVFGTLIAGFGLKIALT